jgi:hypothetical protein
MPILGMFYNREIEKRSKPLPRETVSEPIKIHIGYTKKSSPRFREGFV